MQIGAKIKALRIANDLTLEELASRSELTKGFLSQLERDLTSPSISTLEDILEALGTNLSEFFAAEPEEQIVFHQGDFFIDEGEDHTIEWIIPNAQKNAMEPILLTINPLKKSRTIKSHEGEEFIYVLEGVVTFFLEGEALTLYAGDSIHIDSKKDHNWMNRSTKIAKILSVNLYPAQS